MPLVTFEPAGLSLEVPRDTTLLDAAHRARLPMASACRGVGFCDACRARVVSGMESLSELTQRERSMRLARDERLACQARIVGAVSVTTTYW